MKFNYHHQLSYINFILENEKEPMWSLFVGRCLLIGIKQNRKTKDILEYIFETYHNLDLEEVSDNIDVLNEDMNMYFNNK
jgi:hypothetical protein